MKLHYNIRVTGRVQGVGFRFETQRMARIYGIKGFVKNLPDGSVYIEAEENEEQLRSFILWCKKGPAHARVDEIFTEKAEVLSYEFFDIR
jgi:acylphosphatase